MYIVDDQLASIGWYRLYRKRLIHQAKIWTIYTKVIGCKPIIQTKNNIDAEISFNKSRLMEIGRGKEKNGE